MIRGIQEACSRLWAVIRRSQVDQEFDEELAAHIELLTEHHQRRGMSRSEARRQAILQLGGVTATRELHRETRGLPRVENLLQQSSQAWRSWRNAKTVAVLAAGALAVGIGSATAIYTVVDAVMLKPLPYRDGDRFVALFSADLRDPEHFSLLRYEDAEKYQRRTQAFDAFGWFRSAGKNLTFAGEPHHVDGVAVTLSLVHDLGVEPVLGHWFQDQGGAVISHSLWQRLGADAAIIGKTLTLDGRSYTVTGVMPSSFHFPAPGITSGGFDAEVWMPLDPHERAGSAYLAYGRRKPGVTFAAAKADVTRVAAEIAAEDPQNHQAYTARLDDLRETVVRYIRPTLLLLFAAAGLLFLITCANAAGLLLARSVARTRETAMRVALGASRWQLAVDYLAEGLLVSVAGAIGGVILSLTLTSAIVSLAADYLPRAEDIAVDWTVLLFALGAAFLACVLSSLAPLRQAVRTAPADVLGDGLRASGRQSSQRASRALVVPQIALAFALLAVSSALIVHVRNLSRVSPGFDADQVLTFVLSLPETIAGDEARRIPLQRRLIDALQTIPGVAAVSFANQLPLRGCCMETTVVPDGVHVDLSSNLRMSLMAISPGYFTAMRIPLRSGRLLTDRDSRSGDYSVVINQAAARQYWGGLNPVGAYGRFGNSAGSRFQVVGVVGDVKNDGLSNPTVPETYLLAFHERVESMSFVVRSERPATSLVADIRRVVRSIDPEQPIQEVATMREIIRQTMTLERAASFLTAFFASAALLMSTLGVFGVVSYSVYQRTIEIGIRMALGATSRDVLSLIIGGGLKMAAYGVIAGTMAATAGVFYLTRVFQIARIGVAPFLYSTAIVAAVAFGASFLPAWRAALLSPLVAIRK